MRLFSMKKFLLYLGIVLCLFGLFPFFKYIFDFNLLSSYGRGYILGKVLIITLGVTMVLYGSGVLKRSE
jgi:hypothetical protein